METLGSHSTAGGESPKVRWCGVFYVQTPTPSCCRGLVGYGLTPASLLRLNEQLHLKQLYTEHSRLDAYVFKFAAIDD